MGNQLIGRLAELLREVDPDAFDEAVAAAKRRKSEEDREVRRKDFGDLFDRQIQKMRSYGDPEPIVEMFANQRSAVVAEAMRMTIAEGNLPFAPVTPRVYRTIHDQMRTVVNGEKVGLTYLDPNLITDVVETPNKPYYIFDVEDGKAMPGKSPEQDEKFIREQGRFGLTDVELIAVGRFRMPLHYMHGAGSRCGSVGVPVLWLNGGRPELYGLWSGSAFRYWGSASCGSR